MWRIWHIKFSDESGKCVLYLHHKKKAFVVQYVEDGLNFKRNKAEAPKTTYGNKLVDEKVEILDVENMQTKHYDWSGDFIPNYHL